MDREASLNRAIVLMCASVSLDASRGDSSLTLGVVQGACVCAEGVLWLCVWEVLWLLGSDNRLKNSFRREASSLKVPNQGQSTVSIVLVRAPELQVSGRGT